MNVFGLGEIDTLLSLVLLFVVLGGLLVAFLWGLRAILHSQPPMQNGKNKHVTLMVTVPKFISEEEAKSDGGTQKLQERISIAETFYAAIGGLPTQKGLHAWLFGRTDQIALEMVAHQKLITFYLTVPEYLQQFVEQQLNAQYPDAMAQPVPDYNIFHPTGTILGGYVTLKKEAVLPIKTYKESESDPLNGLTNALSKVSEGDGMAVQYIVRPAGSGWRSTGQKIATNMHKGMSYKEAKGGSKEGGGWLSLAWGKAPKKPEELQQQPQVRQMSQGEQEMVKRIENKISKAGMEVNIRLISSSQSADMAQANLNQILQAFAQYNIYEFGNAFAKAIPSQKAKLIRSFIFRHFSEKHRCILNTEEMASLWHLPLPTTETPTIRWMLARVAPAPAGMPTEGLHLGHNDYRGKRTEIFIKEKDRQRHAYLIGKTGSGKSWFLRYMAVQDIRAGKGVCVIDPHGDLVDDILGTIPKERIDDVIYFCPSDTDRPMGLNMLEAPNESMKDFAVQEMISIFYMLFPPEMIGPMFEHSMRNYMLTLMADQNDLGTIAEIPRMIADDAFQAKWVAKVTDPVVQSFWKDEMAKTSDYHKSEMMGYLVSKVGRFVENEMIRNIIGQSKSAFDFRQIMDEGKILLVNLSKGKTGEVNANLLGLIMVAKLQMAAFSRAELPEDQRRDFFLYIDEFQNFITPSIATILSEARKYRLNLTLAHQYMGQLVKNNDTQIRDAVLGNVGNMFVARIGPEDAEVFTKVFEPTFGAYDLMNTDNYTWNAKIVVDMAQLKPFTLKVGTPDQPNPKLAEALKEMSRLKYGKSKEIVEKEIALRSGIGAGVPNAAPIPASEIPPSR
ncbi:MAG: type IV secretory system conjugative DNA transfer family protein [Patescibacteria group bacterium]